MNENKLREHQLKAFLGQIFKSIQLQTILNTQQCKITST